ncbi:MAG: hypothetical protein NTW04_05400 [Elusimicrobia bacterium]|nr:hypothetical protein [Elusimicrobiota bacterium]
MVKNPHLLAQFEREYIRNQPLDYAKNMKIFEAMYNEAVALGILPSKDPLEGIEDKIRLVKILNYVPRNSK